MERNRKVRWRITCSKCRGMLEPTRRGKQAYCRKCHAEFMRRTRPKHRDLKPEARMKANARAYAKEYQRRGKIIKQPCVTCGSADSQKHHEDYSKPLEVIWMCRKCHQEYHNNKKQIQKSTAA